MSLENRLILVREEELRKISVFDFIGVVFVCPSFSNWRIRDKVL